MMGLVRYSTYVLGSTRFVGQYGGKVLFFFVGMSVVLAMLAVGMYKSTCPARHHSYPTDLQRTLD